MESKFDLGNRVTNSSNQIGWMFFFVGALTNSEMDLNTLEKASDSQEHTLLIRNNFNDLLNSNMSLFEDQSMDDERIVLEFANKLLSSSRDIDPEISKILQRDFWELL